MDQLTPRERLAKAVIRRREEELGLSRQRVVTLAEIAGHKFSVSTLRNIEAAHSDRYARDTLDALDAGLNWPAGTARTLLEGEREPTSLAERLPQFESVHRDKLIAVAVPARKLTDAEAVMVVLRCLSDDQYALFARAVQADDRFASVS